MGLGILGQIRDGKGIDRVIAEYQRSATFDLTIAGPYATTAAQRHYEPTLRDLHAVVEPHWLPATRMRELAAQQDYILLLYDDWDNRMESGVFYLAASVGRPVVVFSSGWCARQVETYRCGVIVDPTSQHLDLHLLPRPGSREYARLSTGMRSFAEQHRGDRLAGQLFAILAGSQ